MDSGSGVYTIDNPPLDMIWYGVEKSRFGVAGRLTSIHLTDRNIGAYTR